MKDTFTWDSSLNPIKTLVKEQKRTRTRRMRNSNNKILEPGKQTDKLSLIK